LYCTKIYTRKVCFLEDTFDNLLNKKLQDEVKEMKKKSDKMDEMMRILKSEREALEAELGLKNDEVAKMKIALEEFRCRVTELRDTQGAKGIDLSDYEETGVASILKHENPYDQFKHLKAHERLYMDARDRVRRLEKLSAEARKSAEEMFLRIYYAIDQEKWQALEIRSPRMILKPRDWRREKASRGRNVSEKLKSVEEEVSPGRTEPRIGDPANKGLEIDGSPMFSPEQKEKARQRRDTGQLQSSPSVANFKHDHLTDRDTLESRHENDPFSPIGQGPKVNNEDIERLNYAKEIHGWNQVNADDFNDMHGFGPEAPMDATNKSNNSTGNPFSAIDKKNNTNTMNITGTSFHNKSPNGSFYGNDNTSPKKAYKELPPDHRSPQIRVGKPQALKGKNLKLFKSPADNSSPNETGYSTGGQDKMRKKLPMRSDAYASTDFRDVTSLSPDFHTREGHLSFSSGAEQSDFDMSTQNLVAQLEASGIMSDAAQKSFRNKPRVPEPLNRTLAKRMDPKKGYTVPRSPGETAEKKAELRLRRYLNASGDEMVERSQRDILSHSYSPPARGSNEKQKGSSMKSPMDSKASGWRTKTQFVRNEGRKGSNSPNERELNADITKAKFVKESEAKVRGASPGHGMTKYQHSPYKRQKALEEIVKDMKMSPKGAKGVENFTLTGDKVNFGNLSKKAGYTIDDNQKIQQNVTDRVAMEKKLIADKDGERGDQIDQTEGKSFLGMGNDKFVKQGGAYISDTAHSSPNDDRHKRSRDEGYGSSLKKNADFHISDHDKNDPHWRKKDREAQQLAREMDQRKLAIMGKDQEEQFVPLEKGGVLFEDRVPSNPTNPGKPEEDARQISKHYKRKPLHGSPSKDHTSKQKIGAAEDQGKSLEGALQIKQQVSPKKGANSPVGVAVKSKEISVFPPKPAPGEQHGLQEEP